jgi:hypothetical protein
MKKQNINKIIGWLMNEIGSKSITASIFTVAIIALITVSISPASAAITVIADYKLGAPGSIGGTGLALDSSGNGNNFQFKGPNANTVVAGATVGSSALQFNSPSGFFNAGAAVTPTINFAVEFRFFNSDVTTNQLPLFISSTGNPLAISMAGGKLFASYSGADFIGSSSGTSILANTWTHVAVIDNNGTSSLYLNGIDVGSPSSATATNRLGSDFSGLQLGVGPGFTDSYNGIMSDFRIFTYNPVTDNAVASLNLIPEPSTVGLILLALGSLVFLRRMRVV